MFNWLTNLFHSKPETPSVVEGVYRAKSVTPKPTLPPPRDTLFERPAIVPVVPAGRDADAYRWLNDELPISASTTPPVPVKPTEPHVRVDDYSASCSGSMGHSISGMCYATGAAIYRACTGIWRDNP